MPPLTNHTLRRARLAMALMVALALPVPGLAQGAGVRGGLSVDPDQVYFGGHYETERLVDRLSFRPNIELGLGDDLVTTAINMEFVYTFPSRTAWSLYVGGGPAVNFYSFDSDRRGRDDTETEGGFNFLFGAGNRDGLFFEIKVGAIDSPDVKFGVGYTFK